jgi:RHS repeat-associated protein
MVPDGQNWDRTDYYYNSGWQAVEERFADAQADKDAVATAVEVQYVWSARYIDAPVVRDRDADGQSGNGLEERLYYTTDANMNVTALVDTDGAVQERYIYDPYGKVTFRAADWSEITWANSKKNEILSCGYRFDPETGLYHVRHRYYHPTLGRWVSRDPIGRHLSVGPYEYVVSQPGRYLDPSGLWPWTPQCDREGERRCRVDQNAVLTLSPKYTPDMRKAAFDLLEAAENLQLISELGDVAKCGAKVLGQGLAKGGAKAVETAISELTDLTVTPAVEDPVAGAATVQGVDSVPKAIFEAWEAIYRKTFGVYMFVKVSCEECQCKRKAFWWDRREWVEQKSWWFRCVPKRKPLAQRKDAPKTYAELYGGFNTPEEAYTFLPKCLGKALESCQKKCCAVGQSASTGE